MNLYGFAGGDPVNFSDPMGLSAEGGGDCPPGNTRCLFEGVWNIAGEKAKAAAPVVAEVAATVVAVAATEGLAAPAVAGDAVAAGATRAAGSALGRLAVRAQVELANNRGLSIGTGLVAGYNNLPMPGAAPALFTGAYNVGRILNAAVQIAKTYGAIP